MILTLLVALSSIAECYWCLW